MLAKYQRHLIGAELQAHRKASGLSQTELAKRLGFTRCSISYWETKAAVGTPWGVPRAMRTCLGFEISADFLEHNARVHGLSQKFGPIARVSVWAELRTDCSKGRKVSRNAEGREWSKDKKGNALQPQGPWGAPALHVYRADALS